MVSETLFRDGLDTEVEMLFLPLLPPRFSGRQLLFEFYIC